MTDDIDGVVIGSDGQCNCCKAALARASLEWWPGAEGERRMSSLVERLRTEGRGRRYDAIVGLSGGIDSAYLAHHMATKHGLRLLAIHVDAGWNSEPAVHNIEKLVRRLDLDLITYVINWEEMRDVQRAFLKASVLNQDFPQDHAFFGTLVRAARKNKVRSFLSGVNFSSENLHVPHDGPSSTDGKHLHEIHRRYGERALRSFPIMTMAEYLFATKVLGMPARHRPLDYMAYDKTAARAELEAVYGWRDYGSKHSESRFTKFYQDVYLPRKYRFDKRRLHLSSLIVSGQLSRREALIELATPVTSELQAFRDTRFVAKKLEFEMADLEALIVAPLVPHERFGSDKQLTDRLIWIRSAVRQMQGSRL
jgi:hypothetical protein